MRGRERKTDRSRERKTNRQQDRKTEEKKQRGKENEDLTEFVVEVKSRCGKSNSRDSPYKILLDIQRSLSSSKN